MIRACTTADLAEISAIINDAAQAYRGVIPADRWHEPYMPLDGLEAEIDAGVAFWAALDGHRLEAVMGIQPVKDVALVRHAYTRTASQGRGHGAALLAHVRRLTERPILIGTWSAAAWAIRFYERHGFRLVPADDKAPLLRRYWTVPERQIEESVVLADDRWFARAAAPAPAPDPNELRRVEEAGVVFVEGPSDRPLLASPAAASRVIEACLSHHTSNALLHAGNLTSGFFDVSSREAGDILQRLRNYGIRMAVVCPPGAVRFSTRFGALLNDERRHGRFAVAETRAAAIQWLAGRTVL